MATGLVLTVAQTLLSALQTQDLRNLCSMFGYESQLADMERTVETIKAVLLDAESKHQELNNLGKDWLGKLKDVVYDADDLFDEFNTIAQQHKRMPGSKISKKVHRFFSSSNQLFFAAKTSRKIKKLRKKLDSIANDRTQFGLSDVYVPVKRREETCSYMYESSIIGREADKEAILSLLLLESDVEDNVSFVSIIGIGGMGKTALAQLVYNDEKIKSAFEICFWVCVSDRDFSTKEFLSEMVGKSTEYNLEELHREVRRKIEGRRYFLVLDDVWNESRDEWVKLKDVLCLGARGSRIVVTTRSKRVARAIGDYAVHELKGLSNHDSWCLFKRIAFNQRSKHVDDALVEIGKDIVKKCANVPLSIRVIGSMLYDQDESKWLLFQKLDLGEMGQREDGIMPILKFSYYHLTQQLKSCFSYCALFPKDYDIDKQLLINLWLAQGCLECPNNIQNIEDIGDEYFMILLHRCFFQDIRRDAYGRIHYVKMHDLIHDLAQEVAGRESCLVMDASTSHFNEKLRHVSVVAQCHFSPILSDTLIKLKTMRTFLRPPLKQVSWAFDVSVLLANCKCIRVLDLHSLNLTALPNTLSNLSHLRYLDLSCNATLKLPNSISKLHNLQVLNLCQCRHLKALPGDLTELVNLRHLDLTHCDALTHMPAGMGSMIGLSTLTMFVLGGGSSDEVHIGQLTDLMSLINLRGKLQIIFTKCSSYDTTNANNGGYLLNKKYIKDLTIAFYNELRHPKEPVIVDERWLEGLQPHHDLRKICLRGYKGIKLSGWAGTLATSLPHLVGIHLSYLNELEHLPQMSQLRHLKILELENMWNVEYMEDNDSAAMSLFYPSLKELSLKGFPRLKGWWKEVGVKREAIIPSFSVVHELVIEECPKLTCFPGCPQVKDLTLLQSNEELTFCWKREEASPDPAAPSSSEIVCNDLVFNLDHVSIDNVGSLNSLFGESLQGIRTLYIKNSEVECLSAVAERYLKHALSTKSLSFSYCRNLKSLSEGGIEHMTNLRRLEFEGCIDLVLEEERDGMPWKALHNLSSLSLVNLPKVVNLPTGIQYLSSLRDLSICICYNLEGLPEWLDCLTSLRSLSLFDCHKLRSLPEAISRLPSLTELSISDCDGLRDKCREPDGDDWPKIRHVPCLRLNF